MKSVLDHGAPSTISAKTSTPPEMRGPGTHALGSGFLEVRGQLVIEFPVHFERLLCRCCLPKTLPCGDAAGVQYGSLGPSSRGVIKEAPYISFIPGI